MKRLTLATLGALAVLMSAQALATIDILPGETKTVLAITQNTHFNAWCTVQSIPREVSVFSIQANYIIFESYSENFAGRFTILSSTPGYYRALKFNGVSTNGTGYGGYFSVTNQTIAVLGQTGILTVDCDYTNHAK